MDPEAVLAALFREIGVCDRSPDASEWEMIPHIRTHSIGVVDIQDDFCILRFSLKSMHSFQILI